jgi:hypothetical protein
VPGVRSTGRLFAQLAELLAHLHDVALEVSLELAQRRARVVVFHTLDRRLVRADHVEVQTHELL